MWKVKKWSLKTNYNTLQKCSPTQLLFTGNDTVPISVWRGESMRFIECHSFKLLCTALLLLSLLTINIALVTIVVIVSATVIESTCIRIGPRFNANCCNIVTRDGRELAWTNVVRYLGIFTESASCFKCFLDNAKRSFYWSFNGTFGRVARIAS